MTASPLRASRTAARSRLPGSALVPLLLAATLVGFSTVPGCGDETGTPVPPAADLAEGTGPLLFVTAEKSREALADALQYAPNTGAVVVKADPAKALGAARADQVRVAVVTDERCAECYRLEGDAGVYTVRAGGVAGISYGVTALLESLGYTFFHPYASEAPAALARPAANAPGFAIDHAPAQTLRGVQLHTLHPIEAYFDFWEHGADNLERAKRDIDWIVRQRGNFVQWVAMQDPQADSAFEAAYRSHTKAITEYAHRRGVKIGVAVQLFKKGSLQNNFILARGTEDIEEQIKTETHRLVDDTGIDMISLNFGEFTGVTPDTFIATANSAVTAIRAAAPNIEISGTIHVGEHNRVDYQGKNFIYYFLIDYVDPSVKRWVHTVMYYDLEGPAGGAYDHENFHEHQAFIKNKIATNQQVAYFPESAYWIAFDNSVPTFLPVYVEQRRRDMALLPGLKEHILFTSGWEWGYWQTDAATLRMGYELPPTTAAVYGDLFAPLGEPGKRVADLLTQVAAEQRTAHIDQQIGTYVSGRDGYIDLADKAGAFHSQPDRVIPTEVTALAKDDPAGLADFEARVIAPLSAHADKMDAFAASAADLAKSDQKALREIADGLAVTAARTRFALVVYQTAIVIGKGEPTTELFAQLDALLEKGKAGVAKRHADTWDPTPARLFGPTPNSTQYPYGYLKQAHNVCFWGRELAELKNLRDQTSNPTPNCTQLRQSRYPNSDRHAP